MSEDRRDGSGKGGYKPGALVRGTDRELAARASPRVRSIVSAVLGLPSATTTDASDESHEAPELARARMSNTSQSAISCLTECRISAGTAGWLRSGLALRFRRTECPIATGALISPL